MSRRLTIGLAVVGALAAGTLLWWVLTGPTTRPPSRQSIRGLSDTASIGWTDQHTAVLNVPHDTAALTALGYVHGMTRAWTLTLWRRTALGTLAKTFGDGLVPLDQHARRLGFAHHARRAFGRLPDSTRQRLREYTQGINAALRSERVRRRTPFVYLNITPRRWAPWHPLAIERLWAWTGTTIPAPPDHEDTTRSAFRRTDRRLRRWLHLHGRGRSLAWAARPRAGTTRVDTGRTALFARHVLGATAEPVIQEVLIRRPDRPPTALGSVPGTLLFPTGTTGGRAWTYLLRSPARIERVAVDTSRVRTRHERVETTEQTEFLVEIQRYDDGVLLAPASPDSALILRWPGLRAETDLPEWMATATLRPGPDSISSMDVQLIRGDGLAIDANGRWTVQGAPPVVERGPGSILVGRSPWARHQAAALRAHRATAPMAPGRWSRSDSSTWAAALLPRMLSDLEPLSGTSPLLSDALSYLRNWDRTYVPASIGAVVFEEWIRRYQAEIGQRPSPTDSVFFAAPRRRRTFRQAVHHLADQYGRDVRRWRWERIAPERRYFPVWTADSLIAQDLSSLSGTRYAPLDRPGRGHASSLSGGPSLVDPLRLGPAPTHWDGWMQASSTDLTVRRVRFDPSDFFARSLLSREPPSPVSVTDAPVTRTTTLVPAND